MDAALARLLMLRLRGGVRLRLRQLSSLRGALFALAIGGIAWVLFVESRSVPDIALFGGTAFDARTLGAHVDTFMPVGLLAMTLFTVLLTTGPSFHFAPNEINFLFVGPFSRRDLIVYKFTAYLAGAFLTSALVTLIAVEQTGSAVSAFAATFLTLVFMQLNSAALGMAWQGLVPRWRARILGVTLVLLVALAVGAILSGHGIFDLLAAVRHSWIGSILLFPYAVFAQLFQPQPLFPDFAGWAALAVLINTALLQWVIRLDGRTTDLSLSESRRQNTRWDRIRQNGSLWATDRTEVRSARRAPVLGGLGPVVWRQVLNVRRNAAKVAAVFIGIAAATGPLYAAFALSVTDTRALAVIFFFFTFIVPRTLICDFRSDLGRMEIYKTLPVAPWRICAGQLVVQTGLTCLVALTMIVSVLIFAEGVTGRAALILAAFAPPFALLLHAVENTIFLLAPVKLVPMGRADFEFLGRAILEFMIKALILLAASVAAMGAGGFTFAAMGYSWFLAGLVSWLTLALIGLLAVVALQYAFRRFAVAETFD